MLYKQSEFPKLMNTAGKITILTALAGMMVFVVAFLFDAGTQQLSKVSAQTATTTLTVLNTPPSFTLNAYEVTESSTSSPTNSGSVIQWRAIGTDTNAAPYFLLICSTNASPTANAAPSLLALGTVPPTCGGGATRWGVSAGTASGVAAIVSTTTTEVAPFAEVNNWYAWVCDDDPTNPRCNTVPVQGYSATNSSPFNVNKRPVLTNFYNNGPVDPGGTLTFLSTSTDPDTVGGEDTIKLVVCQTNSYSTTTNTCTSNFLASTTVGVTANATAIYSLASIVRDNSYGAFGFIVDQHGHEALANPISQGFTVNNVAPTTLGADISLNGGNDITLTVPGDETTGFTLAFTLRDANSCVNTTGTIGSEFAGYRASVYRSSVGTTTCNSTAGSYNANNCYPSQALSSTWNLSCTASTTSCTGPTDDTMIYNCTFPLWFIADPTDAGPNTPAAFAASNWLAAVAGVDDDGAIGPLVAGSSPVELISFTALDLITAQIPYGALEPGNNSGTLNATTTIESVGNTGLDQEVSGESMCGTFSVSNECDVSATSTVPENQQKFASTSRSYGSPLAQTLSSTTIKEVELDVNKTTSTSTPNTGITYWGIAVPSSITLAGAYTGLNTFIAKTAEAINW
jgi:hypothetical protein